MKKYRFAKSFFVSALISLVIGVNAQGDHDSLISHLDRFISQWHLDAANASHKAYIGAMATDGVYIGTDATEHWTTAEFSAWSKPYFDRKKTWHFTAISRKIYTGDDSRTAWFDELLDTQMGVCRGSGVLQKQDGQWKIAQYVLSATIPNDLQNKMTILKSGTDSSLVIKGIFDKYGLTGTMLIFNPVKNQYSGYNPSLWDSGYIPASTFKIPNTLIGLETGVIDTGFLFKWNGEKRRLPQWEHDLNLKDAFRVSCVPCYQELARKIGPDRMKLHLQKMKYPGMDVHPGNIDLFWLEGKSRITPRQQVEFIRELYEERLPLKKSVMQAVKNIMVIETANGYTVSGKTGWATRDGNNYGWFVGYIETGNNVYFVATLVEPKNQEQVADFAAARKTVTMEVMRYMQLIPEQTSGMRIDSLAWLCGTWEMETGQGMLSEIWEQKTDSLFLGASFMISGRDTLFSEKISLVQKGTDLYYIPVVSGQNDGKPVLFRLVSESDDRWVFENPEHDFPQQIIYSHPDEDSLVAIVAGIDKGKQRQEVFRMKKKTGKP